MTIEIEAKGYSRNRIHIDEKKCPNVVLESYLSEKRDSTVEIHLRVLTRTIVSGAYTAGGSIRDPFRCPNLCHTVCVGRVFFLFLVFLASPVSSVFVSLPDVHNEVGEMNPHHRNDKSHPIESELTCIEVSPSDSAPQWDVEDLRPYVDLPLHSPTSFLFLVFFFEAHFFLCVFVSAASTFPGSDIPVQLYFSCLCSSSFL